MSLQPTYTPKTQLEKAYAVAGILWLLYVACVHVVYRGLTQSLTIDEALTYHLFINQDWNVLVNKFEANYHLLPTWFMWIGAHHFGKSEAILRLPSMVCGLLYLAGSWKVSRVLFPRGWPFLVSLVVLTSNPFLLDHLSVARGYGPALAFFAWASIAIHYCRYVSAGVLLALSVLSNLTFLIPVACAIAVGIAFSWWSKDPVRSYFTRLIPTFVLTALPGLSIPLLHAGAGDFFYGADTLDLSISTLTVPAVAYWSRTFPEWINAVDRVVLPILCLFLLWAGMQAIRARKKEIGARALAVAGSTLTLCVIGLVVAHNGFGLLYPWSRTGIYLIWLFLVTVLAAWSYGRARQSARVQFPSAFLSIVLAGIFVSQTSTAYYYDFRDDAPVSSFMARLRQEPPKPSTCIGGSWRYDATVNYYLLRYRIDWIEKMRRTDKPEPGCRFYILELGHKNFVSDLDLTILDEDAVSGATLAESKPRAR